MLVAEDHIVDIGTVGLLWDSDMSHVMMHLLCFLTVFKYTILCRENKQNSC